MAFSVKIKQESVDSLKGELSKAFGRVIKSNQMLNEIGETIVTDVVDRTREGKSIPDGNRPFLFISEAWSNRRNRLTTSNTPHESFDPGKSNITFTGRLLDALMHKILGPGKIKITFEEGNHPGYKNLNGIEGASIPYSELAKYIADAGRPFVGVRPTISRAINRIVKKFVKRSLVVSRLTKQ